MTPPYTVPILTGARFPAPSKMFQDRVEIGISWLSGQRLAMQRFLERLVRQSSFTQDPPGVNAVVHIIDQELRRIGLKTERIPSKRFGDHLYFESVSKGEPAFLIGHTDTVFPRAAFNGFSFQGDIARGPGAFDMKDGLVVG